MAKWSTSDYSGLDIHPFWGVIRTAPRRRQEFSVHQGYLYPRVRSPVKPIRPLLSPCHSPATCPAIPNNRSGAGGISRSRCQAAGSQRHREYKLFSYKPLESMTGFFAVSSGVVTGFAIRITRQAVLRLGLYPSPASLRHVQTCHGTSNS